MSNMPRNSKKAKVDADPLLTAEQVAEWTSFDVGTLRVWRHEKRMLPFVKFGRAVRYRKSDVEAFIKKNTVTPPPPNL